MDGVLKPLEELLQMSDLPLQGGEPFVVGRIEHRLPATETVQHLALLNLSL
jgi:hypothetical protein